MRFPLILLLLLPLSLLRAQTLPTDGPLTIDTALQALASRLLEGKQGSIIALEPQTGKVLCLVSSSTYTDTTDRAIGMAYSPGSTFKTAQALTLLSLGTLSAETQYACHKGFWTDNIHIGCHEHRSPQSLRGALSVSCNSYFCKAFKYFVDHPGKFSSRYAAINRWHAYMASMGLGQSLGIDLPGEAGGFIPDSTYLRHAYHGRWNGATIMWVGMGQGEVKLTPLQLCNLCASIANRGYWYTPHIHQPTPGHPLDSKYTVRHRCLPSPKAYQVVIDGMRGAVTYGTAKSIKDTRFTICGKTGTAENTGEDHSIFMGFAPMTSPRIAVSVYIENGGFGADLAAPIAALLIEQYLTGTLLPRSEHKVRQWENYIVLPYPEETILDDKQDDLSASPTSAKAAAAKSSTVKPAGTSANVKGKASTRAAVRHQGKVSGKSAHKSALPAARRKSVPSRK